eukprot:6483285-Amphidinium_carterae.1
MPVYGVTKLDLSLLVLDFMLFGSAAVSRNVALVSPVSLQKCVCVCVGHGASGHRCLHAATFILVAALHWERNSRET